MSQMQGNEHSILISNDMCVLILLQMVKVFIDFVILYELIYFNNYS